MRLMSNNPDKVQALEDAGVTVAERVPCIAEEHESRRGYLETKREKMGHLVRSGVTDVNDPLNSCGFPPIVAHEHSGTAG